MTEMIRRVAKLARIAITAEEETVLAADLNSIIKWVEKLDAVDVSQYQSASHATGLKLILREDQADTTNRAQEILQNAPESAFDMFSVPKVVE